jgi:isocitrate lyase
MREDMDAYDKDSSAYTQSLGCWHGFIGQQKIISIKKHFGTNKRNYLYLSGWMIAALRSEFGPLPDQSMHEKTSVASLINELYTFLRQADARELGGLFRELDAAEGDVKKVVQEKIDNFETHIVPIIADIDAGFGNAEATYLMAKQMIEAGACCIQIENQVSDEKQCGHQDGKVTVPHSDFLAKINAVRYAFLELGVDEGVIVARTDSLGAGLTKQIAVTHGVGDLGDQYNSFLDVDEVNTENMNHGDVVINHHGKLVRPKRLPSNLYQFKKGTGEARCILDSITSLQNGADLIWIETEKPHIGQIGAMMNQIKKVIPNAKLVYNNSPSFNWTLNFRQQVFDIMEQEGGDTSAYKREALMDEQYDDTDLGREADEKIRTFQVDSAREAGIFHHLITLPTYHTAALSIDNLAKEYFGDKGMLGYVKEVQRKEIREGIACVKHQNMAGSDMGDDHKGYFAGEAALKASGQENTMHQFD